MKLIFYSLSILFSTFYSHDIQVAYFKIYKDDQHLIIDLTVEKEDVLLALDVKDGELTDSMFHSYLMDKFSLKINGVVVLPKFNNIILKSKHLKVKGIVQISDPKINELTITNTLFLSVPNHSNIIEIRLNNQERDFLMDEDRTKINVSL